MKKTIFFAALAVALGMNAGIGKAQMPGGGPGMMQGYEDQEESRPNPQNNPYMMSPGMMGGYGMGPGMMGGYGMGPGMMGGYGMGPGMMGGYGMGPQMMGGCGGRMSAPCYGYGPGMMEGYGYGKKGYPDPQKYKKFYDETKELRKKLHDLRFEYGEMMRNPDTTMKEKMDIEKQMFELQQKIQEKAAE